MKTRPARVACLLLFPAIAALSLGACSTHDGVKSKHRDTRVFEGLTDIDHVEIRSKKGRVDIAPYGTGLPGWAQHALDEYVYSPSPDSYFILAVMQSDERKRLEKAKLHPEFDGTKLILKADWPHSFSDDDGDGVEYAIRLPAVHTVDVDNDFGDIEIKSAQGDARIRSGFGDVELHALAGSADVDTGFGDIEVYFVGDSIERSVLDTGFGDIDAENIAGPIKADSGFGDIKLELTDDNAGPVDANSGFGDVKIYAGPAFEGRHKLHSGFGKTAIRRTAPEDSKRDVTGKSEVSTGFGDATVTIREPSDPK
ncbi:MAG: hypothetical protein AAGI53_12865 [Planctomycetota bacterium]